MNKLVIVTIIFYSICLKNRKNIPIEKKVNGIRRIWNRWLWSDGMMGISFISCQKGDFMLNKWTKLRISIECSTLGYIWLIASSMISLNLIVVIYIKESKTFMPKFERLRMFFFDSIFWLIFMMFSEYCSHTVNIKYSNSSYLHPLILGNWSFLFLLWMP